MLSSKLIMQYNMNIKFKKLAELFEWAWVISASLIIGTILGILFILHYLIQRTIVYLKFNVKWKLKNRLTGLKTRSSQK